MAIRYIIDINNNDDLNTVIRKCNRNFKVVVGQQSKQDQIDANDSARMIGEAVSSLVDQIENEAEARRDADEDIYNIIEQIGPGTNVSGVKGNAESSYRTGNVNLTPANIGAAPTAHASTATTYGKGTDSNYGHVKLSDSTSSTTAASSGGTAATPKAVSDALAAAKSYADGFSNQNAFSNVKVGSTTVAADAVADTIEFVAGSNVTITPDATNDKVTIAATDTTYSAATSSADGLMSSADKAKLDSVTISNGVIDSSNLPSFVDDVIEAYARSNQTELGSTWLATGSASGTVITPETGKIYVLMNDSTSYDANSQFRWGGTSYVKLSDGGVSSITNAEIDTIVAS